ncbi:MAG: methyltransferase [Myxococcaceae bacterium]
MNAKHLGVEMANESQQMFKMVTGYWVSQMVGTAARMSIADVLEPGAQSVDELAKRLGADSAALYRLMRGLASAGVFSEREGRTFANNTLSQTLRSNVPGSMRDMAIAQTSAGHWRPWERLTDAVKTGSRTTPAALGSEIFQWYGAHPEEAMAFSGAMDNLAALVASEVVRCWDFAKTKTVVDLGGANGTLVKAVLNAFPSCSGTLFDLPHVIGTAAQGLEAAGLKARCEAIGGDFFQQVPQGEVFLLKQILHDWNDEQSVALLKNVAKSMRGDGRVLVVEMIIPDDNSPSPAQLMDLNMLVMLPGRERTAKEYGALFAQAGLTLTRVLPTHSPFSIVEAKRA